MAVADQSKDKEEPEVIEEYLDEGHALCVAFNRRGTMLACKDTASRKAPAHSDGTTSCQG